MRAAAHELYGGPEMVRSVNCRTRSPRLGRCWSRSQRRPWTSPTGRACGARRVRAAGRLRAPRRQVPGSDVAAPVEAVCTGVTRFVPGRRGVRRQTSARERLRRARRRARARPGLKPDGL